MSIVICSIRRTSSKIWASGGHPRHWPLMMNRNTKPRKTGLGGSVALTGAWGGSVMLIPSCRDALVDANSSIVITVVPSRKGSISSTIVASMRNRNCTSQ